MVSSYGHSSETDTRPQNIFNNKAVVLTPGQMTTDKPLLLVARSQADAELLAEYANTQFFRRLLHIDTKGISIPRTAFKHIPDTSEWIDQYTADGKPDLNTWLYTHYHLSDEIIVDIDKRISKK